MRQISTLALLMLLSSSTLAKQHAIVFGTDYHHSQSSSLGAHIGYQWRFDENFELDIRYIDHQKVDVNTIDFQNELSISRATAGLNFIRNVNESLIVKAGTGFSYLVNSNDRSVIEDGSASVYLRLSTQYQFSNNVAFEFGQSSYFDSDKLDTNHNIFMQVNWQFSGSSKTTAKQPRSVTAPIKHQSKEIAEKTTNVNDDTLSPTTPLAITSWYCQLAAFKDKTNANDKLNFLKATLVNQKFSIKLHNGYYKVISNAFESKKAAKAFSEMLESRFNVNSFVALIPEREQ